MKTYDLKRTLKTAEKDIINLKRKIKLYQRERKYSQVGWRKKLLTKLQRKVTLIYKVLESYNTLEKEWKTLI